MSGKLTLVPTPVGNLEDITLRAIRVLREAELVLAEDTRVTGQLLKHLEISKPLQAFHQHNEHRKVNEIVDRIRSGSVMVYCSDAGTPGISDPGFLLVRACLEAGIVPEVLPGATAFVPALVASGFACDRFVFEGFLPHKKGRSSRILEWKHEPRTVVIYESTHRIARLMRELNDLLQPERNVVIHREISKKFEQRMAGSVAELAEFCEKNTLKGELVVILEGWKE